MGILLCEHNFRNVWIRNESVRAEIGQILHTDTHPHTLTHTHTTAAKLVVRIGPIHGNTYSLLCAFYIFFYTMMCECIIFYGVYLVPEINYYIASSQQN